MIIRNNICNEEETETALSIYKFANRLTETNIKKIQPTILGEFAHFVDFVVLEFLFCHTGLLNNHCGKFIDAF